MVDNAALVKQPTAAEIRAAILSGMKLGGSYGYDPQFDQGVNDLYAGQATGLSQLQTTQDRAMQDYGRNEQKIGENRDNAFSDLKAYFADHGMVRSGANVSKQSEIGKGYTESLSDLVTQRTRTNEDIEGQRNSIYDYVRDSLAGLKNTYTGNITAEQQQRDAAAAAAQTAEKEAWVAQARAKQDAAKKAQIGKVYAPLPVRQTRPPLTID